MLLSEATSIRRPFGVGGVSQPGVRREHLVPSPDVYSFEISQNFRIEVSSQDRAVHIHYKPLESKD